MRIARIRTAAVAAVMIGATSLIGVAVAQPAEAAFPVCNGTTLIVRGTFRYEIPTIGNGTGNYTCGLVRNRNGLNDVGAGVRSLQAQMNACYGPGAGPSGSVDAFSPALGVDGRFGSLTEAALRKVQTASGATPTGTYRPDGEYGPQTRSKMKWLADRTQNDTFLCTTFPG
jgi:hypothetical protein